MSNPKNPPPEEFLDCNPGGPEEITLTVSLVIAMAVALLWCTGCEIRSSDPCDGDRCPVAIVTAAELPPVDPAVDQREPNYAGGSCMHASLVTCFRWQGLHTMADWWRDNQSGACSVPGLARIAESRWPKLRYAYTSSGDAEFLAWCSRTRRGAAIHYYPGHAVTFAGFTTDGHAALIDNNRVERFIYIPKAEFVAKWQGYGGFALVPVYSPTPPRPHL